MEKKSDKSRREFLKGAAVAGGTVAIVASTGSNVMAAEETDIVTQSNKSQGYHETQHVHDYYNSLRK